jgi:hypothetical protein
MVGRACNVAIIATLTSRSASLRHGAMILVALLTAMPSPSVGFSPTSQFGIRNRLCSNADSRPGRHQHSSLLFASEDDGESSLHEDREGDDEIDIITQKLSRNAQSGPINPVKEHDKMMKENEDEAKSDTNGTDAPSTLYSHMLANALDPDFDPSASTDEAYVESQFGELLSRDGKELARLGPGIATLPLEPSSDEAKSENELARKERELREVVDEAKSAASEEWDESNLDGSGEKQAEILRRAAELREEIDRLHVDDCGAVLLANLAFYEAFSLQDPEGMKDVWWQSPGAMCVHPSHPPLIGSNAVTESFARMFEHGLKRGTGTRSGGGKVDSSAGVFMTPTNIRGFSVRGSTASLVCDEEVHSKGSGQQGGVLVNKLLTTNVFRKICGKWKMVHRHASWHPETTAAQEAMKAKPGIVLYDSKRDLADTNVSSKREGMTLRRLNGDGTSKRPSGLPSIPPSLEGLDANAVLGVPVPEEEEPKKSKGSSEDGIMGKIINLSDLLGGGGDNDEDKSEDKGISDILADMLGDSAGSDNTQTTGSGTPEDPFITRRVIKIGPEGIENLTGKKSNKPVANEENNSEDEDQDVVIDLRGKSEEERKEALSQLLGNAVDDALKDAALQTPEDKAEPSIVEASVTQSSSQDEQDGLRQQCVATLRKLSDHGLLSAKQKRVLLTDIITSSAKGETSMVEVAYDLLVSEEETDLSGNTELGAGMEDFAEQCRVFASMGDEGS